MKINYKLIGLVMFVMLICCVSAASATDVDNITVPDDTGIIEIDDTVDSVNDVEIEGTVDSVNDVEINDVDDSVGDAENDDGSADDSGKEQNLRRIPTINGNPILYTYFANNGYLRSFVGNTLTFSGDFTSLGNTFGNFKIDRTVTLNVAGATFTNIGFDLLADNLTLNGASFNFDARNGANSYVIDIENADNVIVSNNKIIYTCGHDNAANYNYAIKAMNSEDLTISGNEINATVPLKQPNWAVYGSIASDYVAGVAIENCTNFKFTGNNLTVIGDRRVGDYPTLDALIIAKSKNAEISGNIIYETDVKTAEGQYSYIYGIDVYLCDNLIINNNTVNMNGNKSGGNLVGGNGTGAAYCIQLTGPHNGIVISNNTLITRNQGPNLGIYSQNYDGNTTLTIYGNHINVTGKAGSDPWSLVSGMELQDTNATVYDNVINVNNTAGYHANDYAFGISYAQSTSGSHYYDIHNNNVTVVNGDYAVYLLNSTFVTGQVIDNKLIAVTGSGNNTGNNAVSSLGLPYVLVSGNY